MRPLKIALLDLNNQVPNQGMPSILALTQKFQASSPLEIEIDAFEVRIKQELPKVRDYDIFISSGGPGSPHPRGEPWEGPYAEFLEALWEHNKTHAVKKYAFLICYSFQLAVLHWRLGTLNKRFSYGFGIMPVHKTDRGDKEPLFEYLPDPFYAVDSRGFQFIEPDYPRIEALGIELLALEKIRPHIDFERAIMAVRFSNEIIGTQFHPEAEPESMLINLELSENRAAMIENFGLEKYEQTRAQLDDPDKIRLTQRTILPGFLESAAKALTTQITS